MKTKLLQMLMQFAALVFLVVIVVRDAQRADFDSLSNLLSIGGIIAAISFGLPWINKKFPEPVVRCRVLGKLVWAFISIAMLAAILAFFDLNTSGSAWSRSLFVSLLLCLAWTYDERKRLLRELIEKEKLSAIVK